MGGKSKPLPDPDYIIKVPAGMPLPPPVRITMSPPSPPPVNMVTLRVTALAIIDDEKAREVALRLLEDTARDLQLKLLLLADGLPGVEIDHRVGNGTLISKSISSESLPLWLEEQKK